ncbi:MAG: crotonobetainyl-CoA:carnitine CoA-transferase CaiB-like acyl-CoA transferase [Candidatus Azotimanducaceae bacterium]|jgi:crotonobetainyl-CoA:carnitine CoA-transferase CaiB-like acyl-CoA transferase
MLPHSEQKVELVTNTAPLAGLKVLDLSRVLAGPWASQTLADMGADVIKIERPGLGDDTRTWGPPWYTDTDGEQLSAYFMSANRGKRSVTIDMATDEGQMLVREFASRGDILIENFKVGDMARRGLDYASLHAANPRLIYCSITGFGQTGPYKERPGYDFMIQGMSGLMSITGEPDSSTTGGTTGGPQKVGVAVADIMTGLYSTIAILGAIEDRHRSGLGQCIDMSLFDVMAASLANQASNYLVSGVAPGRLGNAHPNVVPYQTFATSDGYIIVAVGNDSQFRKLCEAIDMPQLATDPAYLTNALRVKNRESLVAQLQPGMQTQSLDHWLQVLEAFGVPCGPINTIDRLFADPQAQHRGVQMSIDGMPLVSNPIRYSRSSLNAEIKPPVLGRHTDEVLQAELGLDQAAIDALRVRGVLGQSKVGESKVGQSKVGESTAGQSKDGENKDGESNVG